ncbi:hypothetical protein FH966_01735 [Lentibacillus cibarius]|uniref:Uncharacterized protein n=1 Tax=Lentibacillus cibarius TaxID=2583219 RepID=A0A549YF82_9BACI|nr:hypothetical protein [Lentibacillus cibarius]TRM10543.1 hypothetical protein FH966_01735 [Lentibacillus cibarius]
MNDNPITRPNELVYINLQCIEPFIDDLEIPNRQFNLEQRKISNDRVSSILPEVTFDPTSGHYLLLGGYTTLFAYRSVHSSNTLVPCKAYYHLAEDECYLLTLDWVFKNNITNWYNRHDIITKLTTDFLYTENDLAAFLSKQKKDIQLYLAPPSHIETETVHQQKENIINKIYLQRFVHNYNQDYLAIRILYLNQNVTTEQLTFIGWLRGNGIKFEECHLTLEQEHRLIDSALNLKRNFLDQIRRTINEMRIQNGDEPIF